MRLRTFLVTLGVTMLPSIAFATTAVTTGTGAGFSDLAGEIDSLLSGPLGYTMIIASVVYAAVMLLMGNWKMMWAGLVGAAAIGYMPTIMTSFAGVSAVIEQGEIAAMVAAPVELVAMVQPSSEVVLDDGFVMERAIF